VTCSNQLRCLKQ